MKKKNQKHFLDQFEKKWQKNLVIVLLMVVISSLTFTLMEAATMIARSMNTNEDTQNTADADSSASSSAAGQTTVLSLTDDAGRTYQDSTLYLGDSNTVRFMSYNDTDGLPFTTDQNTIAVVGMGVQAIDTLECEQLSTGTYTMTESVPILQPERILITFGTNNLDGSTMDPTGFITEYTEQLQKIQEAYPSVDIIVNSIPPISSTTTYTKLKPAQITAYNEGIQQMCETNGWHYLNSYEALCDSSTGYAKSGYTADDGLHLSTKGLQALFTYYRTHAYITEDDRPKPLSEIPEIIGPKTTMYSVDPLTNNAFSNSVLNPTPEATQQAVSTPASTPTPEPATPAPTADTSNDTTSVQNNDTTSVQNNDTSQSAQQNSNTTSENTAAAEASSSSQ